MIAHPFVKVIGPEGDYYPDNVNPDKDRQYFQQIIKITRWENLINNDFENIR